MAAKSKKPFGLLPANHHRVIRHLVDQDYTDALDPDAAKFLAEFNLAYYSNNFTGQSKEDWPQETRDKHGRALHHARRDAEVVAKLRNSKLDVTELELADTDPPDTEAAPRYLNHPRYKAALQAWRDCPDQDLGTGRNIHTGHRAVRVKVVTAEKRRLRAALDGIIRLGQAGLLDEE